MKKSIRWLQMYCALTTLSAVAEDTVIERGPHQNIFQNIETVILDGQTNYYTNTFTQIGSGLNYFDVDQNAYVPSTSAIELFESGALYRQGQYKLSFSPNINNPNGNLHWYPSADKHIVIRTIGIAVTDEATGDSIWLGQVKDAQGFLTASNEVTWVSCFDQIDADVRVSVNPYGFLNDIVLHEKAGNPGNFQGPVRIEAWHQIIAGPEPELEAGAIPRSAGKFDADTQLKFGPMMIGSGTAFLVGTNQQVLAETGGLPIRVSKDYFIDPDSGSRFLIEGIPLSAAENQMQTLPASKGARKLDPKDRERLQAARRQSQKRRRPIALLNTPTSETRKVAAITRQSVPERSGLLLDFQSLVTTSNKVLQGDTTYVVATNTAVNLTGATVLEPGCVIKFGQYNPANSTPIINILGTLDCQTRPYCPAVFTSREDRTVGETNTAQVTSVATNAYGAYHICIPASNTNAITLHDIRSRYALNAFGFLGTNSVEAWNIQVVSAQGNAFEGAGNAITLRNILVNKAKDVTVASANNTVFTGEHFTIHSASKTFNAGSYTGCSLNLTNSLVVVVTNSSSSGFNNISGDIISDDTGIFQIVGAGSHYLSDGSQYRNTGTSIISPRLSTNVFTYSTTYPPLVLSNAIKIPITLTPQAQRDLDTYNKGYHYPAIDWAVSATITTDVTLTNGASIACFGTGGLVFTSGNLYSEGRPLRPNRLFRYNTVQEQPIDWGATGANMRLLDGSFGQLSLRSTEFSHLANSVTRNYLVMFSSSLPSNTTIRDCEVMDTYFNLVMCCPDSTKTVGATNNVFLRSTVNIDQGFDGTFGYALNLELRNNLFRYGTTTLTYNDYTFTWEVYDNLFDNNSLSAPGYVALYNGSNGYIGTTQLSGGSNNKTITSPDYQTGALGGYYYPTAGTELFTLVNAGSRTTIAAGLYHYTTRTDQTKDSSNVDIGYHYVALDGNGLPYDTDADGIPDHLEDRNGNGVFNNGETAWTFSVNNLTGLTIFTPLHP